MCVKSLISHWFHVACFTLAHLFRNGPSFLVKVISVLPRMSHWGPFLAESFHTLGSLYLLLPSVNSQQCCARRKRRTVLTARQPSSPCNHKVAVNNTVSLFLLRSLKCPCTHGITTHAQSLVHTVINIFLWACVAMCGGPVVVCMKQSSYH